MNGNLVRADIAEQPQVLERVLDDNVQPLQRARALAENAVLVRLLAIGSSRHVAGYAGQTLDVLAGVPASVLPAPGSAVELPRWRRRELAVAVSQSGQTPALIEAVTGARDAGVPVVAVVNQPGSPLEALADVTLRCRARPERVVAATKSVTAQALLLRALAEPVPDAVLARLVATVGAVIGLDAASALGDQPPSAVVASGFAAEWVADEVALKLAEMTGHHAAAESLVEHLHGPVAARGATLAFVERDDPNAGALPTDHTVRVGRDAAADLTLPATGDTSLDAIVNLVAGQILALAWAGRLGEDPDAPRGLAKVTPTR